MSSEFLDQADIEPIPECLLNAMEHEIGAGSHGAVYTLKANDTTALKEYNLESMLTETAVSLVAVLQRTISLDHQNILNCHRIMKGNNCIYVEMDRHKGSLEALIRLYKRKATAVPVSFILHVARCVSSALRHIHSIVCEDPTNNTKSSLVHGNLTPANILLDKPERGIVVSDMRLFMKFAGKEAMPLSPYSPPEVRSGEDPTPKSDMWSLGVILYRLTTTGRLNASSSLDSLELSKVDNSVLRGLIERLLIPDPERRISSEEMSSLLSSSEGNVATSTALEVMFLRDELQLLTKKLNMKPQTSHFEELMTFISFPNDSSGSISQCHAEVDFTIPSGKVNQEEHQGGVDGAKTQLNASMKRHEATIADTEESKDFHAPYINQDLTALQNALEQQQVENANLHREVSALRSQEVENRKVILGLKERLHTQDMRMSTLEARLQQLEQEKTTKPSAIPVSYLNGIIPKQGYLGGNAPSYATQRANPPPDSKN